MRTRDEDTHTVARAIAIDVRCAVTVRDDEIFMQLNLTLLNDDLGGGRQQMKQLGILCFLISILEFRFIFVMKRSQSSGTYEVTEFLFCFAQV